MSWSPPLPSKLTINIEIGFSDTALDLTGFLLHLDGTLPPLYHYSFAVIPPLTGASLLYIHYSS